MSQYPFYSELIRIFLCEQLSNSHDFTKNQNPWPTCWFFKIITIKNLLKKYLKNCRVCHEFRFLAKLRL